MKNNKFILGALVLASAGMTMPSCSDDFIKEDLKTAQSTEYFKTQDGLDQLIVGSYSALKFKFNYGDWSYRMWTWGTDEFTDANNEDANWNGYMLNSTNGYIGQLWDNMYGRIESINIAIKNIPLYYSQSSATYNTRLGEALFLRAFCFFQLVQQYGGVPLKIQASDGSISTEFERASAEECYAQIIADFEEAYKLLPKKAEATGRITKSAAAHFIAKAKLFRASELNADWNSKYVSADLDDVIAKGTEVLAEHPLAADYVDLWDFTAANSANETNPEVVLAAQFSNDESTWGRFGNQMHLAYPAVYQDMAGTKRDISGDREFCYFRTTNYTLDVFDRVNDSRFWKSFVTTYGCNSSKDAPKWSADQPMPAGVKADDPRFKGGEVGIKYIINDAGDTEYENLGAEGQVTRNGVMEAPHTFVRFFKGDSDNWYENEQAKQHGNYGNYVQKKRFVALSKYRDGYRNAIASQFGVRDGIIARSAEDVLFVAEAYARKKDYAQVVTWVNKLRARAAYKAGEDRAKHVDGGQSYKNNPYCEGKGGGFGPDGAIYCETNTYFESNKLEGKEAETNAQSSEAALLLADVNSITNSARDNKIYDALTDKSNFNGDETYKKVMNFILNERTRELCGEMQRWIDLSRCKALKGRWEAFNDGCGRSGNNTFPEYKVLRPIPQTNYIDAITNANAASQQNPGY